MNYQVTVGDRTLSVGLRREGDQLYARVDDGQEQPVRLDSVRGPLRSLVIGDRHVELLATHTGDATLLAIDGLDYRAEVLDERHASLARVVSSQHAQHARRELKAPMPGLVVKILVDSGQTVEASQPLVVLQAMKMENELSLPRGGTVQAVSVQAGQTVEQGQVLVVVE